MNDDSSDNRFYEDVGRFPEVDEDEEALPSPRNRIARSS